MVVRGPRLALRYARRDDATHLVALAEPEVVKHFSWGPYTDASEALAFIESLDRQRDEGTRLEFVIVDESDTPIGITGLTEFSRRDRRAIVGTWLGREHWGTGANAESKALILSLAFNTLGLLRVTALASPDNERSLRALEKLGFVREGVLAGWHVHRGEQRDVAILRLMKADFDASELSKTPVTVDGSPLPSYMCLHPGI